MKLIMENWRRFADEHSPDASPVIKEARDKDRGKNFDWLRHRGGSPDQDPERYVPPAKVSSMEDPLMRKNREKHPDADRVPSDIALADTRARLDRYDKRARFAAKEAAETLTNVDSLVQDLSWREEHGVPFEWSDKEAVKLVSQAIKDKSWERNFGGRMPHQKRFKFKPRLPRRGEYKPPGQYPPEIQARLKKRYAKKSLWDKILGR